MRRRRKKTVKTQRRTTRSNKWHLRKGKGLHPSEGRATLSLKVFLIRQVQFCTCEILVFLYSLYRELKPSVSPDLLRKEGSNAEQCLLFSRSLSVFFRGGGSSEIPSTWQRVTTRGLLEGGAREGGGKLEVAAFGWELPLAKSMRTEPKYLRFAFLTASILCVGGWKGVHSEAWLNDLVTRGL